MSESFHYTAIIVGGIGPDVWEREFACSACDIVDAVGQAHAEAEEMGGWVVDVGQSDYPGMTDCKRLDGIEKHKLVIERSEGEWTISHSTWPFEQIESGELLRYTIDLALKNIERGCELQ